MDNRSAYKQWTRELEHDVHPRAMRSPSRNFPKEREMRNLQLDWWMSRAFRKNKIRGSNIFLLYFIFIILYIIGILIRKYLLNLDFFQNLLLLFSLFLDLLSLIIIPFLKFYIIYGFLISLYFQFINLMIIFLMISTNLLIYLNFFHI